MVHLAENCEVYSVRATAFYSLGLVASTKNGADSLFKLRKHSYKKDLKRP